MIVAMCLLIAFSRTHPDFPLVVAANRDELLDRPAVPMAVLRDADPRVLGGRDGLAGGTWLAVGRSGVVAALTNRPATTGRDPTRRTRGELPIMLAAHSSAAVAVDAFAAAVRPRDYNPGWLLVGDRDALYAVDVTSGEVPAVRSLPPGLHILENRPLDAPSPKVDHVRRLLDGAEGLPGDALVARLGRVLADHEIPAGVTTNGEPPAEVNAPCVHTDTYGTRWSGIVAVPAAADGTPPRFLYADGPPCRATRHSAAPWWG